MDIQRSDDLDIVWGAAAIGRVINRTARQTHWLLQSGAIDAAKKVNGLWCADRNGLRAQFCGARPANRSTTVDAATPAIA